jgi:MFS transporter, DHA2 family, multidrug resistance protein
MATAAATAGRREWAGLAVLAFPTLLLSLDISVLFLAMPKLSAGLRASGTQQLWITDIYGFMTAALAVTMGSVGDRAGRRRVLLAGAAAFGGASAVAAFSVSAPMLIAARALMGCAGAALLPSVLGLIGVMFSDARQRSVAMAVWMTTFMAGIALGPVIGGVLLDTFWWGSVFLMGVPVMAVLLIAGPVLLPEYRDPAPGRIDLISVALSLAAILPVIYGLKELARNGLQVWPSAAIAVGAGFGVMFVRRQRRLAVPLLDLRLLTTRALAGALIIGLVMGGLQSGTAFLAAEYLQLVAGLTPARAGVWLALPAVVLIAGINLTPQLARRIRPAYVVGAGLAISMLGQFAIARVGTAGGLALLIAGVSVVYFGVGPAAALINVFVLDAAPARAAASAEAVSSTGGELGVALGIAALGSISGAVYHGRLVVPRGAPLAVVHAASQDLAGAVAAAGQLPHPLAASLLASARAAFTSGLSVVAVVCGVLFGCLALVAVTVLRWIRPIGAAADASEQATGEQATGEPAGRQANSSR